jgi:hypothetical protein
MDIVSIGAAVNLVKSIPGSAAERAETAAEAAEAAAAVAETHNYGISVVDTVLAITPPTT